MTQIRGSSILQRLWAVSWVGGGIKSQIWSQNVFLSCSLLLQEQFITPSNCCCRFSSFTPFLGSSCLNRRCLHIHGDGRRWASGCFTPEDPSLSGTRQEWAVSGGGCPAASALCLSARLWRRRWAWVLSSTIPLAGVWSLKLGLCSHLQKKLCVYFKSQLSGKKPNCLTMVFPGGWEKCQMEANVVFSGCENQVWGSVLQVAAITAEVVFLCAELSSQCNVSIAGDHLT